MRAGSRARPSVRTTGCASLRAPRLPTLTPTRPCAARPSLPIARSSRTSPACAFPPRPSRGMPSHSCASRSSSRAPSAPTPPSSPCAPRDSMQSRGIASRSSRASRSPRPTAGTARSALGLRPRAPARAPCRFRRMSRPNEPARSPASSSRSPASSAGSAPRRWPAASPRASRFTNRINAPPLWARPSGVGVPAGVTSYIEFTCMTGLIFRRC